MNELKRFECLAQTYSKAINLLTQFLKYNNEVYNEIMLLADIYFTNTRKDFYIDKMRRFCN